jgi:hypothetical protein
MKKILSLILVMIMIFALHAKAGVIKTSNSSQSIMLEIAQYNETSSRHRAPMRIDIDAWYNNESNSIDISYDGEASGEVSLYLNGNILDYSTEINTTFALPYTTGIYRIEIISETWSAEGYIQLI